MTPRATPRVCTDHEGITHDLAFSCADAEMDAAEDRWRDWQ